VLLWLNYPDGTTTDWSTFRTRELPSRRKELAKKFPGHM
jgi:hypothetical protein